MNQESRKAGKILRDSEMTQQIIAAAIRVHRALGPGFLESIYEEALAVEFALSGIQFVRQYPVPLFYRDHQIGEHRLDFLVERKIVVELKAVSRLEDIHFAIGRSYLKAISLEDGLLFNFATIRLTIKRFCRERPSGEAAVDLSE
ncbi:MAG: GxxExxY protein [Verrucomicrobia bacterium]|nr:MAG: GxxExxY protein [Verrucomicrobiota bacterium]PYL75742.1 MAG: GxxExxY protein [Verrucomicrobiota bacterium]